MLEEGPILFFELWSLPAFNPLAMEDGQEDRYRYDERKEENCEDVGCCEQTLLRPLKALKIEHA